MCLSDVLRLIFLLEPLYKIVQNYQWMLSKVTNTWKAQRKPIDYINILTSIPTNKAYILNDLDKILCKATAWIFNYLTLYRYVRSIGWQLDNLRHRYNKNELHYYSYWHIILHIIFMSYFFILLMWQINKPFATCTYW